MKSIGKISDIMLAFALVFMLALMLIPLPPFLLDFFLALSITLSILILIVALYINSPLDISVFPGMLLVLTLFRLGLNISSTRLILLEGEAGEIIAAFGSFVVGGNYVVGFIIFLILVLIQFIVIVKGSGRVSEVAARFTLDAMPGKQMAIDADLNSGLINESEAKERRENISREAEFYGAMDGASKFVKGDAIAGLIIIGINIIGGFILGATQRGLSISESLSVYTILTIGDGLVSQIPALIVATAAGLVVTKTSGGLSLDKQMQSQLLNNPRVLGTVAVVVFLFALIPGMPFIPFLVLSISLGFISFAVNRQINLAKPATTKIEESNALPAEEKVEQYLQVDPIEIEIGYGLISLVDESQGGNLFQKIASTRKFIALEYGILIPPLRVRDNLQLNPNEYLIKIKGNLVAFNEIYTDRFLAMNPGSIQETINGIPTNDPAFGLPSYWISKQEKDKAELLGYTVVDAISVLSTHLQETLKKNFDKLLSRQSVKQLLENLKKEYPAVVEDITPDQLSLGTIQKVLQNLLKEFIPIKDLVQILEALIDYSKATKNVDVLTEYVRHSIGETISNIYKDQNNVIRAVALGSFIENKISKSLQSQKEAVHSLGLSPDTLRELNISINEALDKFKQFGYAPIIITSATIRPYFYRLINSSFPDVAILSYTELPTSVEIEFLGKVEVTNAN
ncbi:MAG: flagellar biosynthesis protein FlhA [Chlorobiaceae bacterium]|nr:flagellar biosynthesis protein FlhA [Chlorobiaceae bacterium]MBA4309115.1 flagellar biosynthesis protein FlhA [Chlorobiaceae bacterium]